MNGSKFYQNVKPEGCLKNMHRYTIILEFKCDLYNILKLRCSLLQKLGVAASNRSMSYSPCCNKPGSYHEIIMSRVDFERRKCNKISKKLSCFSIMEQGFLDNFLLIWVVVPP